MYEKAVVCTDLAVGSDDLVVCAGWLEVLGVDVVVLAHVVDVFSEGDERPDDEVEAAFARQIETFESRGFRVHIEAPMGHPVFSLRNLSRERDASLIVIASHGAGIFSTPFPGDMPSDLVTVGETTVFVAASGRLLGTDRRESGQILSDVLCAMDFSDSAERAFQTTLELVGLGAQTVTVLHVQDVEGLYGGDTSFLYEFDRQDLIRLEQMRERLVQAGMTDARVELAHGDPAEEIARHTTSGEHSLIVMGSRGRSARDAVLGGVSERAVEKTRTPILIVPPGQIDDLSSEIA